MKIDIFLLLVLSMFQTSSLCEERTDLGSALAALGDNSGPNRQNAIDIFKNTATSKPQELLLFLCEKAPIFCALKDAEKDTELMSAIRLIRTIGDTKDRRFASAIIGILASAESGGIRHAACYALAMFKDPLPKKALERCLADRDDGVRANAVWALVEIGCEGVLVNYPELLRDPADRVKWTALRGLTKYFGEETTLDFSKNYFDLTSEEANERDRLLTKLKAKLKDKNPDF